jgi:hypothetical protein
MDMSWKSLVTGFAFAAIVIMPMMTQAQDQPLFRFAPATMKAVGRVDERYQSYNIEMLEVTGGRFWKPYKDIAEMGGPDRVAKPGSVRGSQLRSAPR